MLVSSVMLIMISSMFMMCLISFRCGLMWFIMFIVWLMKIVDSRNGMFSFSV